MTNLEFYKEEIRGKLCEFAFRRAICEVLNVHYASIDDQELLDWLTKEHKGVALNEKEKEYLRLVIKPFRERISCIFKEQNLDETKEKIIVVYDGGDILSLPFFEKGKMYRGMDLNKEYTLEELKL